MNTNNIEIKATDSIAHELNRHFSTICERLAEKNQDAWCARGLAEVN